MAPQITLVGDGKTTVVTSVGPITLTVADTATTPPDPVPPDPPVVTNPSGFAPGAFLPSGWKAVQTYDFADATYARGSYPLDGASGAIFSTYGVIKDTTGHGMRDAPATVSQQVDHNGNATPSILNIWNHYENGMPRSACLLPKATGFAKDKGMVNTGFSIAMRADSLPGYKWVPLLWPSSERWPQDGELDGPENDLNQGIGWAAHFGNGTDGNSQMIGPWSPDQPNANYGLKPQDWHVYTQVLVGSQSWTFLVDGKVIQPTQAAWKRTGVTTDNVNAKLAWTYWKASGSGWVTPPGPMHPVFQFETSTSGSAPSSGTQGNVQIDWIQLLSKS